MAEKWAMAACVPGSVHSLDWPPAIWLREKAACFFTQWAWVSDSYVFLRPVPGVSGQRMHLGGQMWLSPKGLVGEQEVQIEVFTSSFWVRGEAQRDSSLGCWRERRWGRLQAGESGVCAHVWVHACMCMYTAQQDPGFMLSVSGRTWRDLFCLSQLLSMFEIYYMGKSFPTAPSWKKF